MREIQSGATFGIFQLDVKGFFSIIVYNVRDQLNVNVFCNLKSKKRFIIVIKIPVKLIFGNRLLLYGNIHYIYKSRQHKFLFKVTSLVQQFIALYYSLRKLNFTIKREKKKRGTASLAIGIIPKTCRRYYHQYDKIKHSSPDMAQARLVL